MRRYRKWVAVGLGGLIVVYVLAQPWGSFWFKHTWEVLILAFLAAVIYALATDDLRP